MLIRESDERLTTEEIEAYWKQWEMSSQFNMIKTYRDYYELENPAIKKRVKEKDDRNKKPNNYIPSAYYKTVVDCMAGYMFDNVVYSGSDAFMNIVKNNNTDVKDMYLGTFSLAYNRGIEYVYTTGDGIGTPEIKYSYMDPVSVATVYNTDIEPVIFCAIRKFKAPGKDNYRYDVIYKDGIEYYETIEDSLIMRQEPQVLYFDECPVIEYKTNGMSYRSPFHQTVNYIAALDSLLSGNSNEIDRLTDAILKLSREVRPEDKENIGEWSVLDKLGIDEVAEYIQKDMSPEFRRYVSELLIQEIHKHSHVVDWYNPESGLGGAVSGKALKTRLFDMDMYSNQREKVYRDGAEKRIRLVTKLMAAVSQDPGEVKIEYNRTTPSDFEEMLTALKGTTIISQKTMVEKLGLKWDGPDGEKKRLEEEQPEIDLEGLFDTTGNAGVSEEANTTDAGNGE